jgi:hypothetical protein
MKLNITSEVLDKLGFSEYWDEDGTWGGRTLKFNTQQFRIAEQEETDDDTSGYGIDPTYIANHYYFVGWFAVPKIEANHYNLFFLHEMYECIEKEYPDCLEEFHTKCIILNMGRYLHEYLIEREK